MKKNEKLYISSKELSQLISIPVFTIQKMVRERIIPAYTLNNGKRYLFDLNEVISIINETKTI